MRRFVEFRLIEDRHHAIEGTVLRLSNEAINLFLGAFELDIEDAQAAAEAVVRSQLERGKFHEACLLYTSQTRRCAVVIDEAHSSQGGETATDLKEVLGGEALRKEAQRRAAEEGSEDLEELFRSMAKRGRQPNLSFFAFTATPKHKTLAVFGRDGKQAPPYTCLLYTSRCV